MICEDYDYDAAEQRFDHDMERLDRIAELEETVTQLEARISALAAENAVLKQGRREPRKGPRCPLRVAGFDQPDTCDEDCAWLICDEDMGIPYHTGHCAISVIARELVGEKPIGMRFVPVYEESEGE